MVKFPRFKSFKKIASNVGRNVFATNGKLKLITLKDKILYTKKIGSQMGRIHWKKRTETSQNQVDTQLPNQ